MRGRCAGCPSSRPENGGRQRGAAAEYAVPLRLGGMARDGVESLVDGDAGSMRGDTYGGGQRFGSVSLSVKENGDPKVTTF